MDRKKHLLNIILAGTAGICAAVLIIGAWQGLAWNGFTPDEIAGDYVEEHAGSNMDMTKATQEWFEKYIDQKKGWTVPYEYRIWDAWIESTEVLEENYIQVNYAVCPVSGNGQIMVNLELSGTGEGNVYQGQQVLKWKHSGSRWQIEENMRPVQYQLQTPELQEEIHKPQTQHYKMQTDKAMTYFVENDALYVTYDSGQSSCEVPDGYEKICKNGNETYDELLPDNSYVISKEFTAFAAYEDEGVYLLYSQDSGNTWLESKISNGYKANTFLSKTADKCYVTFAVDRALGSDYYATFQSDDLQTWSSVSIGNTIGLNLTCSFWRDGGIGYYSGGEDFIYMTKDNGAGFEEKKFPAAQQVVDELGYNPFDTLEEMYEENGIVYMIIGQGDDGDYSKEGKMMKALYQSQDGENFTFVREIADTVEQAG